MSATLIRRALAASLFIAAPLGAAAANLAFTAPQLNYNNAYLYEDKALDRARIVTLQGAGEGPVTVRGPVRTVVLDVPISTTYLQSDSCGFLVEARADVTRVVIRRDSGTPSQGLSSVWEMGSTTVLEGCDAGTTPFGGLDEPPIATQHIAMNQRPPLADLQPGVRLAGLSQQVMTVPAEDLDVDVAEFLSGGRLRFENTGTLADVRVDADKWMVVTLPGVERGYTRMSVDAGTGAERWLQAEFANGLPVSVRSRLMVKAKDGATFGSVARASRVWESGLFAGTEAPFFIDLFRNGKGVRRSVASDGSESRTPIVWRLENDVITQTRNLGGGWFGLRTWEPVATQGIHHFVLEREDASDGVPLFATRVNYYIDHGPTPSSPPSELRDAQGLADHQRARQREQQRHRVQLPAGHQPGAAR